MEFDVNDVMALSAKELRKVIRESLGLAARDSLNFTQAEIKKIWEATGACDIGPMETPSWWKTQSSLPTQPNKANTQTAVLMLLRCDTYMIRARAAAALSRRIPPLRRNAREEPPTESSSTVPETVKVVLAAADTLQRLPKDIQERVVRCSVLSGEMTIVLKL